MAQQLTDELMRRIAQDRANLQMRSEGRMAWSEADYALAAKVYADLSSQRLAFERKVGVSR